MKKAIFSPYFKMTLTCHLQTISPKSRILKRKDDTSGTINTFRMNVETEGLYSFAKFSNVFNARTAPDERRYQAIRNALKTYIFKVVQFMINSQANTGKTSTSSSQFIPNIVEKVTNFLLELEKVSI